MSNKSNLKRNNEESSEVAPKVAKLTPSTSVNEETKSEAYPFGWNALVAQPGMAMSMMQQVMPMPQTMMQHPLAMQQAVMPLMVPPVFDGQQVSLFQMTEQGVQESEDFNLYLCKDDFSQITAQEAERLKNFLVIKLVSWSQESNFAPDFTLKGLQSLYRYEVVAQDKRTKSWLMELDFSSFETFTVLVYTKEELWYERAAIWLPGHTRVNRFWSNPLEKLKLQNSKVVDAKLDKWKFVKKVVTVKGTRLYVDMPPSAARALEEHKMMLSYDLQKVNVFLKAVAVDKDVFDAGLREPSLTDITELSKAYHDCAVPAILDDLELVKIKRGNKTITAPIARIMKEMIVKTINRYLQEDGTSSTDFVKYGILAPHYFAILPENVESRRWLLRQDFGQLKGIPVVPVGENETVFFRMYAKIPFNPHRTPIFKPALALERLRHSNQGVKGINYNKWRWAKIEPKHSYFLLTVNMDLESVMALSEIDYLLDFVYDTINESVVFFSDCSRSELEEKLKRIKSESSDKYDIANMDLATSESSDDDVQCLD